MWSSKATARTAVIVIGNTDDSASGTMNATEARKHFYASSATEIIIRIIPSPPVPDLNIIRPGKKRGKFWESPKFKFQGR